MGNLSKQHQLFSKYYVASDNGTASYQQVYNCSYDSARSSASDLLADPNIQAYIQELRELEKANRMILICQLREENLESIKSNLEMAKLLRDICISKCNEFEKIPITEGWLNAISRASEAISRIEEKAHNKMILMSGLEAVADEILNNKK